MLPCQRGESRPGNLLGLGYLWPRFGAKWRFVAPPVAPSDSQETVSYLLHYGYMKSIYACRACETLANCGCFFMAAGRARRLSKWTPLAANVPKRPMIFAQIVPEIDQIALPLPGYRPQNRQNPRPIQFATKTRLRDPKSRPGSMGIPSHQLCHCQPNRRPRKNRDWRNEARGNAWAPFFFSVLCFCHFLKFFFL